jgi:hypothetical protein
MPTYQIWVLNDDFSKAVYLRRYSYLEYLLCLNDMGYASLGMIPSDPKIAEILLGMRLLVLRDSEVMFGGVLLREGWNFPASTPRGVTYEYHALDYGFCAYTRLVLPPGGSAYDERTDHVDDLAKAFVNAHAGPGASLDRRWAGLTIQADAHAAASATEAGRYDNLMKLLQGLRGRAQFDWRFVPSTTGFQFQTGTSHWGVDRRRGNGLNDECIFSLDRRNFESIRYTRDMTEARNTVFVGGQGEGTSRTISERTDAGSIAAWGRMEAFYDARRFSLESSLQTEGDAWLVRHAGSEQMTVTPQQGTWKGVAGTHWDLGDLVTVDIQAFGRRVIKHMKVIAVKVRLDRKGETVTPVLEAI